ncbi:MAG TPA: CrcB family protein, partial [Gemmatimonadales bacterium]|nr:CrcB family protein [Gemmatimonadales bacterium]
LQVSLTTTLISPTLRLALTTGVMGGFTTYSTFNYETLQYLQQSEWLAAFTNVAATLLACLVAGALGVLGGKLLAGS